jgi:hypothetical protein
MPAHIPEDAALDRRTLTLLGVHHDFWTAAYQAIDD